MITSPVLTNRQVGQKWREKSLPTNFLIKYFYGIEISVSCIIKNSILLPLIAVKKIPFIMHLPLDLSNKGRTITFIGGGGVTFVIKKIVRKL